MNKTNLKKQVNQQAFPWYRGITSKKKWENKVKNRDFLMFISLFKIKFTDIYKDHMNHRESLPVYHIP